jgi:hypothetical protein
MRVPGAGIAPSGAAVRITIHPEPSLRRSVCVPSNTAPGCTLITSPLRDESMAACRLPPAAT